MGFPVVENDCIFVGEGKYKSCCVSALHNG